jgi:hypothetical protein
VSAHLRDDDVVTEHLFRIEAKDAKSAVDPEG